MKGFKYAGFKLRCVEEATVEFQVGEMGALEEITRRVRQETLCHKKAGITMINTYIWTVGLNTLSLLLVQKEVFLLNPHDGILKSHDLYVERNADHKLWKSLYKKDFPKAFEEGNK